MPGISAYQGISPAQGVSFAQGISLYQGTAEDFNSPVFSAQLKTSIIPEIGGTPTFTRATAAQVFDHEGWAREAKTSEARFWGARRVENLATALTTHTITVVSGAVYQAVIAGTNGTTAVFSGAFTGTLTANGTNRISWPSGTPKTASSTSLTITVTGTLTELMITEVSGAANQNPPEYVDFGTSYGANVDGVKYFDTLNGNTVDANGVVTETTGVAISASTLWGYYSEGLRTNYALYSRDLTNSAWVKTSMTAALDQTGIDGRANSASSLLAIGANATAAQAITRASAQRVSGWYVKRLIGTGTVEISQDNGATWTAITGLINGSTYTRVATAAQTLANPTLIIRIVTSGDKIAVDYGQHEEAGFLSTPILTTALAVSRDADSLSYPGIVALDAKGAAFAYVGSRWSTSYGSAVIRTTSAGRYLEVPAAVTSGVLVYDGVTVAAIYSGFDFANYARHRVASRWGSGTMRVFGNGLAGTPQSFTVMASGSITIRPFYGPSRDIKLWARPPSDASLQSMTTP